MVSTSPTPVAPSSRSPAAEDRIRALTLVAGMVVLMWVIEVVDALGAHLDNDGIHPRDVDGLPGIVVSPFLHAGFGHLIGNTIPFIVLGAAIALGGLMRTLLVTAIVVVVGGVGTWLTAPSNTVVIGASGLVFGYATYLVARGVYSRMPLHFAGGLAVLAIYGSTLLVGLVPTPGISWQGHLFGAIGGVVAARVVYRSRATSADPA